MNDAAGPLCSPIHLYEPNSIQTDRWICLMTGFSFAVPLSYVIFQLNPVSWIRNITVIQSKSVKTYQCYSPSHNLNLRIPKIIHHPQRTPKIKKGQNEQKSKSTRTCIIYNIMRKCVYEILYLSYFNKSRYQKEITFYPVTQNRNPHMSRGVGNT